MKNVTINKINETYIHVEADSDTYKEMADYFSFYVKGYRFHPKVKAGFWDGKIKLLKNGYIYIGLLLDIIKFCQGREIDVDIQYDINEDINFTTDDTLNQFIDTLNLPKEIEGNTFEVRDYQFKYFKKAIQTGRALLLAPTGSGKSLIIYLIARYYNVKTLILVPTKNLVMQMPSDFKEYNYEQDCYKIMEGASTEDIQEQITVATFKGVYEQPEEWFDQFDLIIGDEAHLATADTVKGMMEKACNTKYKIGTTGTLDGSKTNEMVLRGLFGKIVKETTTSELIEQGYLADLRIKCVLLKHPDHIRKLFHNQKDSNKKTLKIKYEDELPYIIGNEERNEYIKNLALALKGVTLILFEKIEDHGHVLRDILTEQDKVVYYIDGKVSGIDREEIRRLIKTSEDVILLASYGSYSTGANLPNIRNIIFSSPSKSRIRVIQSIGRGLRKTIKKTRCDLYDIADDLSWKSKKNHTLKHLEERIKYYIEDGFNYKTIKVDLNGS